MLASTALSHLTVIDLTRVQLRIALLEQALKFGNALGRELNHAGSIANILGMQGNCGEYPTERLQTNSIET